MPIAELVAAQIQKYHAVVKPMIQQKEYGAAWGEIGNIVYVLENIGRPLWDVHCGPRCMAEAKALSEALRKSCPELLEPGETAPSTEQLEKRVRAFEVYSAQTRLPIKA